MLKVIHRDKLYIRGIDLACEREKAGMTQREMAERCCIGLNKYKIMEHSKEFEVEPEMLEIINQALG